MKVYISFGQVHRHDINGVIFNKDCIASIECETRKEGREIAFDVFGGVFFTDYNPGHLTEEFLRHFPRGIIELEQPKKGVINEKNSISPI